jgi:isoleucyl-tRNA synthetase
VGEVLKFPPPRARDLIGAGHDKAQLMTTNYKDTLNLPRTDFAMKAGLVEREPQRLQQWENLKLYEQIQAGRAGKPRFVLHDGPPFANGDVHIGTALNKILKDIVVRYKTLRGFSAPYIPGWDCHGLPIEFKVSQEMRKEFEAHWPETRKQLEDSWKDQHDPATAESVTKQLKQQEYLSPQNIRARCAENAKHFIDVQRTQFKRLGVLGDWENPYLTLDKKYEADELRLFADIVDKGFVYRAKKPVYWCIVCRTALAEAEVEYADHISQSVFVKFPVVGQPKTSILIWTTTPWTLPANLAVAYNKDFQYVTAKVGDENFILFRGLLPAVAEKCGWTSYTETPFPNGQFATIEYEHPFCRRKGKAYAADFVTRDTGTGFVHIAPGHGLEDYGLGLKHGLPIYSPVGDHGCFVHTNDLPAEQQLPETLFGKSILEKNGKSEANEAVLALLREKHALLHLENYSHSYPHCWRSKNPVIFRAMDQWFIKIDHEDPAYRQQIIDLWATVGNPTLATVPLHQIPDRFRFLAIAHIDCAVKWIPDSGQYRIRGAVESRPDWCISRQRSWGVPIPFFFDQNGQPVPDPQKNPKTAAKIVRRFADWFEQHGSKAWFETRDARRLLVAAHAKEFIPSEAWTADLKKSNDTLDVWIDSGSSSRAVLKQRPELQHEGKAGDDVWRADVYLEGSDQHRGWFQSSLLLSLAGNGAAPFKTVLTHGFMVDADREKISKSKQSQGGYDKPQTAEAYVKKYGADVVRLWVASQDYRNDIIVSEERVNTVGETYRGIRNALRYQLSNLYDFDPAQHTVGDDQLTGLDRWILREFSRLEGEVATAYDQYEFHVVYQKVSQFVAVELSAIYHDVIKDRLYTDPANSPRRRSTQTSLHRLVRGLCAMISPMLVFTTDEAWEFIPERGCASVHLAAWESRPLALTEREEQTWGRLFAIRPAALACLEKERQAKSIGKALDAKIILKGSAQVLGDLTDEEKESLRELLNVSQLILTRQPGGNELSVEAVKADGQKCERCWHWETDVGAEAEHPRICGRCVAAVRQAVK